jgi:lipopolysaccharide heptosyltransferase I
VIKIKKRITKMLIKPDKILIIRLSAIGDVLRTLPAFHIIRKNFPEAYIAWVVEEASRDILEAHPGIDEVIIFPKKDLAAKIKSPKTFPQGIKQFLMFTQEIKKKKFEVAIDFHGLFKSGIISFLSGAKDRVGFTKPFTKEMNFLFNNRRFSLDSDKMNRIDRNITLTEKLGLNIKQGPPDIYIPDKDSEFIQKFLKQNRIEPERPLIAIHPGTSPSTPYKRWDAYRYAVVADKVIESSAAQIIFTWANEEIEMVKEIIGLMKYNAIVAPETENLCQLAEIFRCSDLYVGSDTGPMHLAAFVNTPVVAIFGPTDHVVNEPYRYTPHIVIRKEIKCAPCRKKNCTDRDCMNGIKESDAIRAINIMLGSFKNKRNKKIKPRSLISPIKS